MITYTFSLVLVAMCFGVIYGLTVAKIKFTDDHKNDKSTANFIATNLISLIISFTITGINISLRSVVRSFSLYEQNETITGNNLSVALKLTLVRFVNTSIVPLIVNVQLTQWFISGGLVTNVFYIFLSICFVNYLL